jgi:hypothetical protein
MSNHINEEIKENKRDELIEQHMKLGLPENEAIKVVDSMIDKNPDWWISND